MRAPNIIKLRECTCEIKKKIYIPEEKKKVKYLPTLNNKNMKFLYTFLILPFHMGHSGMNRISRFYNFSHFDLCRTARGPLCDSREKGERGKPSRHLRMLIEKNKAKKMVNKMGQCLIWAFSLHSEAAAEEYELNSLERRQFLCEVGCNQKRSLCGSYRRGNNWKGLFQNPSWKL